jgi:hypothetical protein
MGQSSSSSVSSDHGEKIDQETMVVLHPMCGHSIGLSDALSGETYAIKSEHSLQLNFKTSSFSIHWAKARDVVGTCEGTFLVYSDVPQKERQIDQTNTERTDKLLYRLYLVPHSFSFSTANRGMGSCSPFFFFFASFFLFRTFFSFSR